MRYQAIQPIATLRLISPLGRSMKEWTGIEIERASQALKQASATILGRMIFEYSRLDMALGLMIVWANQGAQLETLTKRVADFMFLKRLELLADLTSRKYQDNPETLTAHAEWLAEAHAVREERNTLVHGRWGVDPRASKWLTSLVFRPMNRLNVVTPSRSSRRFCYTCSSCSNLWLRSGRRGRCEAP
jgi:hypothetical protein